MSKRRSPPATILMSTHELECLQALAAKGDIPTPLSELRSAREELQQLVEHRLCGRLLPGVGSSTRADSDDTDGMATDLLACLRALAVAWDIKHGSARLVVSAARYLPQELAALLQLLYAPAPHGLIVGSDTHDWCVGRLNSLMTQQEPLAVLEAVVPLVRRREAPPWLRSACTTLLSQCVMRSGGVDALFTCMSTQGSSAHEAAGSLAVKLVSRCHLS